MRWFVVLLLLLAFPSGVAVAGPQPEITRGEVWPVPFAAVHIADPFWSPKLQVYRERTIPHSWRYVQKEIEDNEIAAGWRHEARGQDTPWNQANLHKVLETCAYALAQDADPVLDQKVDGIIAALAAAQQPNGYCNALITVRKLTPWANLDGQHDGYVAGHLIEAAVAHHLATGKTNFLAIARGVADHIHDHFITRKQPGVCGHAGLELALVRLYRVTGERHYLELSNEWIGRRGRPWAPASGTARSYFMDHRPIRQVEEITGHAVRSVFYVTGVADTALELRDRGLQNAARRLWDDATRRKMYVTGAVGSQEQDEGFGPAYDLPNAPGYNESCAGCGMMYLAQAMFRLDRARESVDVLERALYNTVLHGISLDGTSSYYRNPLTDGDRLRNNVWVCCPPCLSRTLLRLPDYVYAQSGDAIYLNLYVGSRAEVALKGGLVRLVQEGDYVRDGKVRVRVGPVQPTRFALRLRQPGWCRSLTVKLNGTVLVSPKRERGYVVLDRRWQAGDLVEIDFALPVERLAAHPEVAADQGRVALQRGPLVYGVEGIDNPGGVEFALAAEPELAAEFRPGLLGGVVVVTGRTTENGRFQAVPFYTLANRGKSQQRVWLSQAGSPPTPIRRAETLYQPLR